jgi:hypothetical protein
LPDDQFKHVVGPGDLEAHIAQIRAWHRQRCFAMEQRKRLDLALGSFLRMMLGGSKDLPESDRKRIADRASAMMDDPSGTEWESVIAAAVAARTPFDKVEAAALKGMSALAEQLPAWATFGEEIRGFGPASLGVIVAEAGNLSNYSNPAKLWKRMGLAVMGDVRQGGLPKNASAELWIEHGYNRQRRSRMWNIGDSLIKSNREGAYRTIYLERKAYEIARDPEIKPIKAHRRAQRYMEKRLLKNLWQAWRRTIPHLKSEVIVPAAEIQQSAPILRPVKEVTAARSATLAVPTFHESPSAPIPAKAGKRKAMRPLKPEHALPSAL